MDHLAAIGFHIENEEDLLPIVEKAFEQGQLVDAGKLSYVHYSDESGAEFWLQINRKNVFIGGNPHFNGKSRRKVALVSEIKPEGNEMDGGYYCWAEPQIENQPESGLYPFVFEVPDFKRNSNIILPQTITIQLSAFAHEINYFENENNFSEQQFGEFKVASKSFIPGGLFSQQDDEAEALGIFSGVVLEVEKKKNQMTGQAFYWMLVDTVGGEIDVVADIKQLATIPKKNGIIHGNFWLSGRFTEVPEYKKQSKKFFSNFFNRN